MSHGPFVPGETVTPSSPRCPLVYGQTYIVERYVESAEGAVVLLEGEKYGVDAQYMQRVIP
jgi:hypothetical protein